MPISEASKRSLATKLNQMVDLPMLGEKQEQIIAERIIDACIGPFENLVPDSMLSGMTSGSSSNDSSGQHHQQSSLKANIVSKLNGVVNIPFANEKQEAVILGMVVDTFFQDKMSRVAEQQQ